MTRPRTDPYPHQRSSALSRSFLPLALITLGVVFLLGNVLPEPGRGSLIVLGLGLAFGVGRVTTGRYGYAVPAGILIAVGIYIGLRDLGVLQATRGPGAFFILLGVGFGLIYLIGWRPAAIWPTFPAVVLLGVGLLVLGISSLAPLAALSWIVGYWPAALVLLGLWLLVRDQLPMQVRRPVGMLGGLGLLAYGVLAAAATVAAGGATRTGLAPGFGASPFANTVSLDAPLGAGQTFTVDNPGGRTTIRATNGTNVHVAATRHYGPGGQAPEVRLSPNSAGVSLEATGLSNRFFFGSPNWVDYAVEVPAAVRVKAQSSSGEIEVDGVGGNVEVETGSGRLNLTNLGGAVQARTSSGEVDLGNVGGEVRVSTSSGQIHGTDLRHLREATATSGLVSLEGVFTEQANVHASSGTVQIKLLPGSAVRLDVHTSSGSIEPHGLVLSGGTTQQRTLTGALGSPPPDAVLSVDTSSGNVTISQ
jgi:hypothetical protein